MFDYVKEPDGLNSNEMPDIFKLDSGEWPLYGWEGHKPSDCTKGTIWLIDYDDKFYIISYFYSTGASYCCLNGPNNISWNIWS